MVCGTPESRGSPGSTVFCHDEPEGSGAAPIVQDGPLAEQMKSPSPVLHYAEGTGKISAPLAEEGHD